MGDYEEVEIQGSRLKVKLVDSVGVLKQLIPTYFSKDEILGLDLKRITPTNSNIGSVDQPRNNVLLDDMRLDSSIFTSTRCDVLYGSNYELLILCGAPRCLIIHLRYLDNRISHSLKEFLQDANICSVRMPKAVCSYGSIDGVEADDLVARVLKKPNLKGSGMVDIAREVGVPYTDVLASSRNQNGVVQVASKYIRVLVPEQVKLIINDAYTCYKIGDQMWLLYAFSMAFSIPGYGMSLLHFVPKRENSKLPSAVLKEAAGRCKLRTELHPTIVGI